MRLGPVSRNNLTLALLFALAFGGVIVYVSASPRAPAEGVEPATVAQEIEPPHGGVPANAQRDEAPPAAQVAAANDTPTPTPDPPLTDKQTQDLQLWSNEVVSGHLPETRANAIRELASMKTQQSIRALAYALSSDEEAGNRLLAVASLNTLANQGYETGAIRDTLRLAAADTDQNVADHAKEAYDQLMRKDEAPNNPEP